MERVYRYVYLLLIVMVCGGDGAYSPTTDGKETSGRLDRRNVQNDHLTRTSCQWEQRDKSVTCEGMHLSGVPDDLPKSTMKLNMIYNNITILLKTSFETCQNLVTLDVSFNNLRTIEKAAFHPLKKLESLDLSGNNNLMIPSSVIFQPVDMLETLYIEDCDLTDLPNDLMDWLPSVKYLHLSKNHLNALHVSRCKTDKLESVDLHNNRFQDLTPDKFKFSCRAEHIELEENPIGRISEDAISSLQVRQLSLGILFTPTVAMLFNFTSGLARSTIKMVTLTDADLPVGIPDGVFRSLYNHTLDEVFIDTCGGLSLKEDIFDGLNRLKSLVLIRNFIKTIKPEYFLGMSRLLLLVLRNNRIVHLKLHNATWQSTIVNLDLSKNELSRIEGDQLRGLRNLMFLNLSRNEVLFSLNLLPFDGFESLETIDVTGTALLKLSLSPGLSNFFFSNYIRQQYDPLTMLKPGQTFNNTKMLEIIDLSNSQLIRGDIWDSSKTVSLFRGLIHLLMLHLSHNPLGNLPDRVFEDNLCLTHLTIDYCKMSSLTANVFKGLQSLVYLDLNGNYLLHISTDVLQYLPVLEILNINDNKLMFIDEGAMEKNEYLRNLSMSNNQLVTFNRSTWNTIMNNLDYIDVSGNPLACQCKYDWLHDLANLSQVFLHTNDTLCSVDSLSQVQGKPLLEFDASKYCVPSIVLVSTLPFVALALLIGLLLAFYNRWLIKYKLFLIKMAVVGYMEMQDAREHNEFVFDLNIMFTEADEAWANEHLRPTLEERLPDYDRYSFGDEDLTLGMHYLEAVHYAVENSFKTILLLSRNAVRDNWFLIKFRTAMDHVHDELTENTIVIFLEDIPEDEIPYQVRLYLSDRKPYMRWPEYVRGQEYFWNQLTKVVTVNLKYNPLIPPE